MTALGVSLIVVALVLFLTEAHLSTGGLIGALGALGAAGGVALLILAAGGSTALVLVAAVAIVAAALSVLVLARHRIAQAARSRPRTGREALIGHVGVVRSIGDTQAHVFVDGSLWRAEPNPAHEQAQLHEGDRVVVERINGLTLGVRKAEEWELTP
jgi:membrane-bound ClpP family serine protease